MFSVLKISGDRLKILPEHKTGNIIRNMQGEYMTEAGNNYSEKKHNYIFRSETLWNLFSGRVT
mgnify:CR=1 FL=1